MQLVLYLIGVLNKRVLIKNLIYKFSFPLSYIFYKDLLNRKSFFLHVENVKFSVQQENMENREMHLTTIVTQYIINI